MGLEVGHLTNWDRLDAETGKLRLAGAMFLDLTTAFVRVLPAAEIDTLPPPSQPERHAAIGEHVLRLLRTRGLGDPVSVTASDVYSANDEWLFTTDNDSLTPIQRAIIGFLCLETFLTDATLIGLMLDTRRALKNIAPAVVALGADGRCKLVELTRLMLGRAENVRSPELWQQQELRVFSIVVRDVDHPAGLQEIEEATQTLMEILRWDRDTTSTSLPAILDSVSAGKRSPLQRSLHRAVLRVSGIGFLDPSWMD